MTQYSHTRLSTFEQCPLKYRFDYIEKPEVEAFDGVEAFLGSRVHESLEQLYKDVQMGRVLTREELLQDFSDRWKKEWHDGVRVSNPRYTVAHYRKVGERCLTDYHRRHHPFDTDRTLGTEVEVSFSLDGKGGYRMRGYIDRLSREGEGRYAIHDYKTGGRLPTRKSLDEDRQLALYQIAVQEQHEDAKKVRLVWHYVAFDRALQSTRTPAQLADLRRETMRTIDRAESEKRWKPRESALCGWCPYQALCPIKGHAARVEALPANAFLKEDGVALVNRLAKAKAALAAIRDAAAEKAAPVEAEFEAVKEALIAYARKHGLQAVRGSGVEARITEKTTWKFPGKNDERRAELEAFLKKARVWEEFSTLDASALAKAMEDLPETIRKVERFGTKLEETRMTLRGTKKEE